MDDTTQSRASDIVPSAATRKRRSSILKSQRPARTPFSEIDFHVATPTDTAKSRRVSFSRRTGVAEFVTNEATTTWKNFYEENNKSLESSGNDSEAHASRQTVEHLGKRIFEQQFEEVDVADLIDSINPGTNNGSLNNINFAEQLACLEGTTEGKITAPQNKFELTAFTDQQSKLFGNDFSVPNVGEMSGRIDINFSALQTTEKDDLDEIQKDLEKRGTNNVACHGPFSKRQSMSEYIEIDLNATHVAIPIEESDMSITDSVHSPKVQDVSKSTSIDKKVGLNKDWAADKENIAINPYVTPCENINFAINDELDRVLVFDGKRLTIQTESAEQETKKNCRQTLLGKTESEKPQRKTIVLNVNDDLPNFAEDMLNSKSNSSGFPSLMDMNPISVNRVEVVPKRKTIQTGNISFTQALPTNIVAEQENEKSRTKVFDDGFGNISVTQSLPGEIIGNYPSNPRRKTVLYEDEMGNISVTQALPGKIMVNKNVDIAIRKTAVFDNEKDYVQTDPKERKSTVFYENQGNISMTQALPLNIIPQRHDILKTIVFCENDNDSHMGPMSSKNMPENVITCHDSEKLKTIVFDDDSSNVSVTSGISSNIKIPSNAPENLKTIVFDEVQGNISISRCIPSNIILPQSVPDKRKTIVFENDDGNISITQVVPSNLPQKSSEKRKTIVFEESDGNISVTQAIPSNIIAKTSSEKRRTIVFEEIDGDISVTQGIPSNIIQQKASEKRKTIVFDEDNGNISVTQAIPSNIIPQKGSDKRRTIVYEEFDGDISVTQAVPSKIIPQETSDKRKTIVFEEDNGNISFTQAIPSNIIPQSSSETRRTIVYEEFDGDVSVTQAVPSKIIPQETSDKRKTIVFEEDNGNISVTQAVPSNIIPQKDSDKRRTIVYEEFDGDISVTQALPSKIIPQETSDKRKTIVFEEDNVNISVTQAIPSNIIPQKDSDKRRTIVYEEFDGDISVTQAVPSKIIPQETSDKRKTIVFEEDNGNISVTQAIPSNIIPPTFAEKPGTIQVSEENYDLISGTHGIPSNIIRQKTSEKQRTIVFEENNGDISVTQAIPCNIIPLKALENRKTIIFQAIDSNISVTQAILANIVMSKVEQDKRKSIVFDEKQDNVSVTQTMPLNKTHEQYETRASNENQASTSAKQALQSNIIYEQQSPKPQIIVDTSITQSTPSNTLPHRQSQEKRQTVVEETAESITTTEEALTTDIMFTQKVEYDETHKDIRSDISISQNKSLFNRSQIRMSNTQSLPNNILNSSLSNRKSFVYENVNNISVTPVLPESTNDIIQENDGSNSTILKKDKINFSKIPNPINVFLLENMESNTDQHITEIREIENVEEVEKPIICIDINEADVSMEVIQDKTNLHKEPDFDMSITEDAPKDKSLIDTEQHNIQVKSIINTVAANLIEKHERICDGSSDQRAITEGGKPDMFVYQAHMNLTLNTTDKCGLQELNEPIGIINDSKHRTEKKVSDSFHTNFDGINMEETSIKEIVKHSSNISLPSDLMDVDTKSEQTEIKSNCSAELKNSNCIKSQEDIPNNLLDMSTGSFDICSQDEKSKLKDSSIGSLDVHTVDKNLMVEIESFVSEKQENQVASNESMFYITRDSDAEIEKQNKSIASKDNKPKKKSLVFWDQTKDKESKNKKDDKQKEKEQKYSPKVQAKSPRKSYSPKISTKSPENKKNKSPLPLQNKEELVVVNDLQNKIIELTGNEERSPGKHEKSVSDIDGEKSNKSRFNNTNKSFKGANDTKELLEMITKFTDKTKCEDDEPSPAESKKSLPIEKKSTVHTKRLSFAPQRLSIVMTREDLLSNISMAQAVLQKSRVLLDDTDDITVEETKDEDSSSDFNTSKKSTRMSNEVVKTLQFDDDSASDTSLKSDVKMSPLKKTVFGETSYMTENKAKVIPTYLKDVSDGIKELMLDLTKPAPDVLPFDARRIGKDIKRPSTCSTALQANLIPSSQIDIRADYNNDELTHDLNKTSVKLSPSYTHNRRSTNIRSPTFASETLSALEEQQPPSEPRDVLVFDHQNPLNNILIGPMDYSNAHKYNPIKTEVTSNSDSTTSNHVNSDSTTSKHVNSDSTTSNHVNPDSKEDIFDNDTDEKISTQYNVYTIPNQMHGDMSRNIPTDAQSLESNISKVPSIDQSIDVKVDMHDTEVNTVIVMKGNKELLEASSSLTLVEEPVAVGRIPQDGQKTGKQADITRKSPSRAVYSINEQEASTDDLKSEFTSNEDINEANTSKGKKRIYSPAHKNIPSSSNVEITPKPSTKLQKMSNSPNIHRTSIRISPEKRKASPEKDTEVNKDTTKVKDKHKSPIKRDEAQERPQTDITIQRLLTDYRFKIDKQDILNTEVDDVLKTYELSDPTAVIDIQDCQSLDAISSFTSSKNFRSIQSVESQCSSMMDRQTEVTSSTKTLTESEAGVNVVPQIDALQFMGSEECQWESAVNDTWCFLLIRGRIRLTVRLAHRHDNATRSRVRADTSVLAITADVVPLDRKNIVGNHCVHFACESMKHILSRSVRKPCYAFDVPHLLRKCAAVARVALRWGRTMHDAKWHLAFVLDGDGNFTLKVANIPLRSVWQVSMRIALETDAQAQWPDFPWPRACDVRVTRVVSDVPVTDADIKRALGNVPLDWGHVPRTMWRLFRYLKNKTQDDHMLLA